MSPTTDHVPEDRLTRLRRQVSHLPPLSPLARAVLLVLGWLLILLGIVGLVLPGLQGILTLVLGAAVLSLVSPRILGLLRRIFRPWPKGWRKLLRLRRRVHGWMDRGREDDGDANGDTDDPGNPS